MLLIIIVLILLFSCGGGYYAHTAWGPPGLGGVLGLVLTIILILYLLGGFHPGYY